MVSNECSFCMYWDILYNTDSVGRCRRYTPVINHQQNRRTTGEWPITYENDWCGEFKKKEKVNSNES